MPKPELDLAEAIIRSLITELGARRFMIGLHNASAHGAVFTTCNDEALEKWFEHVDGMLELCDQDLID
jgi:hypothetical protein